MANKNKNLAAAKKEKNDEFYTQLADIENELRHYKEHFRDKTVFCNCDDPYESNFVKYFAMNFNALGLKKLIATCYATSPIMNTQFTLFGEEEKIPAEKTNKKPYVIEITEVKDENGDGAVDLTDFKLLLKKNKPRLLKGDGDFRSDECIEFLKEADIVVTNPPFSLFREYLSQLTDYQKDFIIIGNTNALTYKEVFKLFKEDKIRTGYTKFNVGMYFAVPDSFEKYHKIANGQKMVRVATSCWFTDLPVAKHKEPIILYKQYNPKEYPFYDNYNAINVDKYTEIPFDYDGAMGVPITFLDKYNPEQFEILGLLQSSTDEQAGIPNLRYYNDFREMREDMSFTGASGQKANGNPVMKGKPEKGNFLYNPKTNEYVHSVYARILIRKKENRNGNKA